MCQVVTLHLYRFGFWMTCFTAASVSPILIISSWNCNWYLFFASVQYFLSSVFSFHPTVTAFHAQNPLLASLRFRLKMAEMAFCRSVPIQLPLTLVHSHLSNILFILPQISFQLPLLFLPYFPPPSILPLLQFFLVNILFFTSLLCQSLSMGFARSACFNYCSAVYTVIWHVQNSHLHLQIGILAALRQINRFLGCQKNDSGEKNSRI